MCRLKRSRTAIWKGPRRTSFHSALRHGFHQISVTRTIVLGYACFQTEVGDGDGVKEADRRTRGNLACVELERQGLQHRLVSLRPHRWPPSSRTCAMWKRNCSSLGAVHPNAPSRLAIKTVHRDAHRVDQHGFKLIAPKRPTMIVMKFTIELDTGLSYLLQSALPLASDRSRDNPSSSWAGQAIVRPLPTPH